MRVLISLLIGLGLTLVVNGQALEYDKFKPDGIIMAYDSLRNGIQTSGTDSTMVYKVFRESDGLLLQKGDMCKTFIPLSEKVFPPGKYSALFQTTNRYKIVKFTIR
jgi:hypothetical protein